MRTVPWIAGDLRGAYRLALAWAPCWCVQVRLAPLLWFDLRRLIDVARGTCDNKAPSLTGCVTQHARHRTKGLDMADSKPTGTRKSTSTAKASKSGSRSTGNSAGAGKGSSAKPKKRRLGRGIGSLLSVPVDVDSGVPVPAAEPAQAAEPAATPAPKSGGRLGAMADVVRGLAGGRSATAH